MLTRSLTVFLAAGLGGISLGLAQDPGTTSTPAYTPPATTYTSTTTSSSSSAMAPRTGIYKTEAPAGAMSLSNNGGANVMQGNAAADMTVEDYARRANHIGDHQYLMGWGTGTVNSGAFSISALGFNWFGAVLGGGAPEDVRLGLATSRFGAGLFLSMSKTYTNPVAGPRNRTTAEADGYGLFGSLGLGSSDLYGELGLLTGFGSILDGLDPYVSSPLTAENTNTYFHFLAGWKKNAAGERSHALSAELTFNTSNKKNEGAPLDTLQFMQVMAILKHGVILRQTSGFSVFAGCNNLLSFTNLNQNDAPPGTARPDQNLWTVTSAPNMSFQKALPKGFEAFTGAGFSASFAGSENVGSNGARSILTTGGNVSVGLRWAYENVALEGSLTNAILFNGPSIIGGGAPGLFGQVGLGVGF